jgi:hypothetical protein
MVASAGGPDPPGPPQRTHDATLPAAIILSFRQATAIIRHPVMPRVVHRSATPPVRQARSQAEE